MKKLVRLLEVGFAVLVMSLLVACGAGLKEGEGSEGGGATTTTTATTGVLNSITISPSTSSVGACAPTQLVATGYYSDGTSKNITTSIFWQIDSTTSSIAIANASNGVIVGINPGTAKVSAWTGNITASPATFTVSSGALTSMVVSPASATIAKTATQTYIATATCSNGALDVSAYNIWSSSNTSVATVGNSGLATAVASGSTVISATAGTVAASSVLNVP